MRNETEVAESLNKMAKEMELAKDAVEKADIVIRAFAKLNNEDEAELYKNLENQMKKDVAPYDKDPMYLDGMMQGIALCNLIVTDGEKNLRVAMLFSVAMATLVKMKDKFVV